MSFKIRRWLIKRIVGSVPVMMNLNVEVKDNLIFVANDRVVYYNNQIT